MSCVNSSSQITPIDISLCAPEGEQETHDSSLPEGQGQLKTAGKHYTLTAQSNVPLAKEAREYVLQLAFKTFTGHAPQEKPSPMTLAQSSAYRPANAKSTSPSQTPVKGTVTEQPVAVKNQTVATSPSSKPVALHNPKQSGQNGAATQARSQTLASTAREQARESRSRGSSEGPSISERQWSKEETQKWWELRYHQKERGGDGQKRDQQQGHQQEEDPLRVTKSGKMASKGHQKQAQVSDGNGNKVRKPELAPPKMGVFALYYILTKIGIQSDGASNFSYKKEVEVVDAQTTLVHQKRLEEMKEAMKKEAETARWSAANSVFSWIGSVVGLIAGTVLIATGVGVVAGAMLIVGSLIQLTSQILEITGGWKKIAEILPGDDPEKKKAIITWMQLGIAVLCLILCGAGAIWGGFANVGEAMQTAQAVMGGIAALGQGVTTIGLGINDFMFKNRVSETKKYDLHLARLRHMRKDLMEQVEWGVDRLEQLFEDLARALEFEEELFQADQLVYRR